METSVTYSECTFPGDNSRAEREISVQCELDFPLNPYVMLAYGIGGDIKRDFYAETGLRYEFPITGELQLSIDSSISYMAPDNDTNGFSHYTAGVSISRQPIYAGLTYIGRIDEDVLPSGPGAYDVEIVGILGLSYSF